MHVPSRRVAGRCRVRQLVVSLPGQIGGSSADTIRRQLLTYAGGGVGVLIADMTAVLACDPAAAAALARVHERAAANGTELRLVISAPAVRRVVAASGLDRLVPVFPSLAAAQSARPPADVLPLPARRAGAAAALPGGSRPVSWLPAASPAIAVTSPHSVGPPEREDLYAQTLTQITGRLIQAGLTLQNGIGLPSRALARAVEDALDLLDSTVTETRSAAFALAGTGAGSPAGISTPSAVAPLDGQAVAQAPVAVAADARRLARRLRHEARQTRAQSTQRRARSMAAQARSMHARADALQIARLTAATRHQAAAALSRVTAVRQPCRWPALGEAAGN